MKIGIVGIGLIGGSILRRLATDTENELYISDTNKQVLADACVDNNAKVLEDYDLDLLILALPPDPLVQYLTENHAKIGATLVTDVCGVKQCVEETCRKYGINYFGMHPMAGREVGGYYNSRANLFDGANLVVTGEQIPSSIAYIINELGFGKVMTTDSVSHDKIIAYTSQLCHIVSNAFAKSPTIDISHGFTGGSFEDLTRVGRLDVPLWISLFDKNRDNLVFEIDNLIANLTEYRNALVLNDDKMLAGLLQDGVEKLVKDNKRK